MKHRPSLRVNVLANFLGRGWAGLLGVVFAPIYVSLIGIEAQGVIGFFASVQIVLGILDLGLSATLNRELARASATDTLLQARHLLRTLEVVYWIMALLMGIGLSVCGYAFAGEWFQAEALSAEVIGLAAALLGVQIAVQFPQSLYNGGLMGLEKQVALNVITSVIHLFRFVGVFVPLWLIGPNLVTFVVWQLLVLFIGTLVIRWHLWQSMPQAENTPVFDLSLLRKTGRFTLGVSATALATLPLTMTDKFLLSRVLSLEAYGYYMLGFQAAMALGIIVGPFYRAYLPRFSNLVVQDDHEQELRRVYATSCQSLAALLIPAALVGIVFSFPLVRLWLHAQDLAAVQAVAPIFALMVVGYLANGLMNLPYALTLAKGWTGFGFWQNTVASVVYLPALYYATMEWGARGAATTWSVIMVLCLIVGVPVVHAKVMQGGLGEWLRYGLLTPLVIVGASVAAAAWLVPGHWSPAAQLPLIVLSAGLGTLGVVVSLPGLKAARNSLMAKVGLPFA